MYDNAADIIRLSKERSLPVFRIVLENEMELSEKSEDAIFEELLEYYAVMKSASESAIAHPMDTVGMMIKGDAQKMDRARDQAFSGDYLSKILARAISCSEVNASMGKICACPTAGACGILPAVMLTTQERMGLTDRQITEALLTASGIGAIIVKQATISGAEGGCQAECGAAAAMAAGALTELRGGTPEMIFDSAAIALKNIMGLICDPVAGMVEVPCAKRNASQAANAVVSSDMAIAGITSTIPFDEVVEAMYQVGRQLPYQLRETSLGGIATTPTALEIAKKHFSR